MSKTIFSLDVRRARKGDCFLLHCGTKENPGLVMIDGGPSKVYGPHLKPRLQEIRRVRKLADNKPLPVDLLMVSHIDDDHINGILELTGELLDSQNAKQALSVKIRSLWHNSFDDIIGNNPQKLLSSVTASFGTASLSGETSLDGLEDHTALLLASVGQGMRLRDDARALKLRNVQFGKKLVQAVKGDKLEITEGLSFVVAGPLEKELAELQKEHDSFLKSEEKKKNKAALAAYLDKSVANLSSIVVLARSGKKTMLLTGDARGDKILEGLKAAKLLKAGKLKVDILKVPHHGSDRNMETNFFEVVTASHYVMSGDGEHGNPERDTFQMLVDARGDSGYKVHLTYPIAEIDAGRKADWNKARDKEISKGKTPRAKWSPKKHSLKAFLDDHPDLAENVFIVDAKKSHVIDLLQPLGY